MLLLKRSLITALPTAALQSDLSVETVRDDPSEPVPVCGVLSVMVTAAVQTRLGVEPECKGEDTPP